MRAKNPLSCVGMTHEIDCLKNRSKCMLNLWINYFGPETPKGGSRPGCEALWREKVKLFVNIRRTFSILSFKQTYRIWIESSSEFGGVSTMASRMNWGRISNVGTMMSPQTSADITSRWPTNFQFNFSFFSCRPRTRSHPESSHDVAIFFPMVVPSS